ncbi:AgrD family cyclic lactone autoinducer peptide [Vibrio diabolicus]
MASTCIGIKSSNQYCWWIFY